MAERPKVIIVDDDRETREMIALALEQAHFEVIQVANGLRLVSILHVDKPDVILLDVNMSWINGFELCRAMRKNEEFKRIPVVVLSARSSPEDLSEGKNAGANAYFPKPVPMPTLLNTLKELVACR